MIAQRQIADGRIEIAFGVARQIHRRAAFGRQRRNGLAISGDHPEARPQADGHRLQHAREVDRIDADPDAKAGEGLAVFLAELAELVLDRAPRQHAETFAELEHDPSGAGRQLRRRAGVHQLGQPETYARLDPGRGTLAHFLAGRPVEQIGGQRLDLRGQDVAARQQPGHRAATPANAQLGIEHDFAVGRSGERLQTRRQILAQRPQGGTHDRLLVGMAFRRVRNEAKPFDSAEVLAFNSDFARSGDRCRHFTLILQSSYKQGRASIDKPLRQTLV